MHPVLACWRMLEKDCFTSGIWDNWSDELHLKAMGVTMEGRVPPQSHGVRIKEWAKTLFVVFVLLSCRERFPFSLEVVGYSSSFLEAVRAHTEHCIFHTLTLDTLPVYTVRNKCLLVWKLCQKNKTKQSKALWGRQGLILKPGLAWNLTTIYQPLPSDCRRYMLLPWRVKKLWQNITQSPKQQ